MNTEIIEEPLNTAASLNAASPNTTEPVSFAFGAKITILNTPLIAGFETKVVEGERHTRILVVPTDDRKKGMSLTELIKEVNEIIEKFDPKAATIDSGEVIKKIKDFEAVDLDKITIELRQVFFLFDKKVNIKDNKDVSSNIEYAFNLVIKSGLEIDKSMKIFDIEELSFAIWNTKRKTILDRMMLGDMDSLLEDTL